MAYLLWQSSIYAYIQECAYTVPSRKYAHLEYTPIPSFASKFLHKGFSLEYMPTQKEEFEHA